MTINYTCHGKKYEKKPDAADLERLFRIAAMELKHWYPVTQLKDGEKTRDPMKLGIERVDQFYTKRNLAVLSTFWEKAAYSRYCNQIRWLATAILIKTASKLHNIGFKGGKLGCVHTIDNKRESGIMESCR